MQHLNGIFRGKLSTAIEIFQNQYHKKFLHQLVSSQLDIDRLDYLRRDSFFTGVSEGTISSDRILKMLGRTPRPDRRLKKRAFTVLKIS